MPEELKPLPDPIMNLMDEAFKPETDAERLNAIQLELDKTMQFGKRVVRNGYSSSGQPLELVLVKHQGPIRLFIDINGQPEEYGWLSTLVEMWNEMTTVQREEAA